MATPEPAAESKHFHERWQFQAAAAVIALLTALWAFTGVPKPWDLWNELTAEEELPLKNTEIILDASSPMEVLFEKETKLEAAARAAGRYASTGDEIGLALRRVGGSCEVSDTPPLLVDFGTDHAEAVREKAEEQQAQGKANLTQVVRAAINDFAARTFHRAGSENKILIFAGNGDECGELPGQELREELKEAKVHAVFQVFGIKISGKTQANLESLKRQLQGVAPVHIKNAENVKQLNEAVAEAAPEAAPGDGTEAPEEGEGGEEGASGESGVVGEG